jgi:hypothetical protein
MEPLFKKPEIGTFLIFFYSHMPSISHKTYLFICSLFYDALSATKTI